MQNNQMNKMPAITNAIKASSLTMFFNVDRAPTGYFVAGATTLRNVLA